jgi:hypothetical protein
VLEKWAAGRAAGAVGLEEEVGRRENGDGPGPPCDGRRIDEESRRRCHLVIAQGCENLSELLQTHLLVVGRGLRRLRSGVKGTGSVVVEAAGSSSGGGAATGDPDHSISACGCGGGVREVRSAAGSKERGGEGAWGGSSSAGSAAAPGTAMACLLEGSGVATGVKGSRTSIDLLSSNSRSFWCMEGAGMMRAVAVIVRER